MHFGRKIWKNQKKIFFDFFKFFFRNALPHVSFTIKTWKSSDFPKNRPDFKQFLKTTKTIKSLLITRLFLTTHVLNVINLLLIWLNQLVKINTLLFSTVFCINKFNLNARKLISHRKCQPKKREDKEENVTGFTRQHGQRCNHRGRCKCHRQFQWVRHDGRGSHFWRERFWR